MTNSQAEKLTKLIELAWDNGWQQQTPEGLWPEYKTIKMFTGAPIRIDIEFPPGIRQGVTGLDAQNVIIFEHDFIKALCKAKYGDGVIACALCGAVGNSPGSRGDGYLWNRITKEDSIHGIRTNDSWCEECDSEGMLFIYRWQYIVNQLAISTNRIDYLYGVFCE